MSIQFFETDYSSRLKERRKLKKFINQLLSTRHPAKNWSIKFIFCSDDYLLKINRDFLKHDDLTDIITFDLSNEPEILTAEIYISGERVAENARRYNVPFEQEIHRVIFHGILHLCGLKDKTAAEKKMMRGQEEICLQEYKDFEI